MGLVGVILIVLACPVFVALLKMDPRIRNWAFIALGAAPVVSNAFNVDAALIDLAGYPGHTKGIVLSMTDALALAVVINFWKVKRPAVFTAIWLAYITLNIPGVFISDYFMASFSYLFQLVKALVYFLACYAVLAQGGLRPLILGFGVGVIFNGYVTVENSLAGQLQAGGLVGHRNLAGMVNNFSIPPLLVALVTWKKARLPAVAIAFAAGAAVLGGSRAVILLFAGTVGLTMLAILFIRPNKRAKSMTLLLVLGSLVFVPAVIYKMEQRFDDQAFTLETDGERLAFKRSAKMIQADYPFGIGHNQYAIVANTGGYADKAGISWATSSKLAIVHDSYYLVRTEGGHASLLALYMLLGSIMWVSGRLTFQRKHNPERLYAAAMLVVIIVFAIHINYEWAIVWMAVLYPLGFTTALLSYALLQSRRATRSAIRQRNQPSLEARAELAE